MKPAPPVTRYENISTVTSSVLQLSNGDATHRVVIGGTHAPKKSGSVFALDPRAMLLVVVLTAILVCSFVAWLVLHLGVEVVQALLALAMMTITWHLLRRRPNMTIADEFRHW